MEEKVLASVNDVNITESDLKNALLRIPSDKQAYFASEDGKKQLLSQMISFELVYCDAKKKGIDNDENYLRDLETVKKDLLIQTAIKNEMDNVTVTENEIKDYYDNNKQQFISEESVTASHILVDTEDKAKEIAVIIKNGLDFADAAKEYSKCPSKSEGGKLGTFTRGKMVPEFEKAAFEAEIGVVTEPVKTQFGYHLILVEDKKQGELSAYEEVKDTLKNMLLAQKQDHRYYDYVNGLSAEYPVEIK